MAESVRHCPSCGQPLGDRVEEEERTWSSMSRSTGECITFRVWACRNPECVMYNTDLIKEQVIREGHQAPNEGE